jgi:hypothetical protein
MIKTSGIRYQWLHFLILIRIKTFFKLYSLKLNPILPTLKNIKDRRSVINLPRCSRIDSLENILMLKTHRWSTIGDMFVTDKMIVLTFLEFPDPDKAHRSLTINDFFVSFVNVYPSRIFWMLKGIEYLLKLHANNLCKPTQPFSEANGEWHSMIFVTVWSLYFLKFFRRRT